MQDQTQAANAGLSAEQWVQYQKAQIESAGRDIGKGLYSGIIDGVLSGDLTAVKTTMVAAVKSLVSPAEIFKRTRDLEVLASKLRNTLGLGSEKSREFSQAIADNAGRFKEFGFSVESIVDTYEDLFKTYKTNVTIKID